MTIDRSVAPGMGGRDALTGLPNRASFQAHLELSLLEAEGTGRECALIVFNVDRFKQFNHVYGHERGDTLLAAIVRRVSKILGDGEFLARLDGDEFAVLACFPHTGRSAALALAQRIHTGFAESFVIDSRPLRADLTIGIAFAPSHASTAANLQRFADLALHAGKLAGGNRISVFNEQIRFDFESRWIMEERLRSAIEADQISVFYQPILDLRTGRIAAVEALARWHHPVLGEVPPDQFIALAEDSQLIRALDRNVLMRACRDTRPWIREGVIDYFSVNLSPTQVPNAPDENGVLATLASMAVDPRTLVLEVTERLMLLDTPSVKRGLQALREKGIRLALDDFGTGFSNLSYLNRFPIDRIKIDRSLVSDIEDKNFARIVVESVTNLAHRLGLLVIVEGVETVAQRQILSLMDCDFAQGFWFSHALPADEMDLLLQSQSRQPLEVR